MVKLNYTLLLKVEYIEEHLYSTGGYANIYPLLLSLFYSTQSSYDFIDELDE